MRAGVRGGAGRRPQRLGRAGRAVRRRARAQPPDRRALPVDRGRGARRPSARWTGAGRDAHPEEALDPELAALLEARAAPGRARLGGLRPAARRARRARRRRRGHARRPALAARGDGRWLTTTAGATGGRAATRRPRGGRPARLAAGSRGPSDRRPGAPPDRRPGGRVADRRPGGVRGQDRYDDRPGGDRGGGGRRLSRGTSRPAPADRVGRPGTGVALAARSPGDDSAVGDGPRRRSGVAGRTQVGDQGDRRLRVQGQVATEAGPRPGPSDRRRSGPRDRDADLRPVGSAAARTSPPARPWASRPGRRRDGDDRPRRPAAVRGERSRRPGDRPPFVDRRGGPDRPWRPAGPRTTPAAVPRPPGPGYGPPADRGYGPPPVRPCRRPSRGSARRGRGARRRPPTRRGGVRRPPGAHRLLVVPQRRMALEKLVLHATSLRIPIVEVEGGSLTAIAGFDGHQGIALVVAPRGWPRSTTSSRARAAASRRSCSSSTRSRTPERRHLAPEGRGGGRPRGALPDAPPGAAHARPR